MASIKVKFRASAVAGQPGVLYYQIIHERRPRQVASDCRVFPSEWDEKRGVLKIARRGARRGALLGVKEVMRYDMERLLSITQGLDRLGLPYSTDDVVEMFTRYKEECSLSNFMEGMIKRLKENGRMRTAETYRTTLNSFRNFRQGEEVMLDHITSQMMEMYEGWLRQRGIAQNTISFYIRILRAVYNRAVEDGLIEDRRPFRHVYTGIDKTVKRALPIGMIRKIRCLDLRLKPALEYARDMFMLSFMLRGMSFVDMAFLGKRCLKNGYVTYRRRKTGQLLTIEWTPEMQLLLDKYPENEGDYLLPIIKASAGNERCAYRNAGYNINHNLKEVGNMAGVSIPLTLYVARHSWASAAHAAGIPVSVISEGMGHDSESTTRIYLASLDTSVVDRANSRILKSIL